MFQRWKKLFRGIWIDRSARELVHVEWEKKGFNLTMGNEVVANLILLQT